MQNGVTYTVVGSDLVTGKAMIQSDYLSQQWSFVATAADWVPPVAGSAQRPDFSAGALPIYVGFRYTLGTSCNSANGCTGGRFAGNVSPMSKTSALSAWFRNWS